MPASTEQKVDFLLKKIGYSASKTGGVEGSSGTVDGTKKKPSEEAIPSPLIVPSTSLWSDSVSIPATPPGSDTFPVKVYATASAYRLTVDNSVSESRSFIARSTYGNASSSIDGNWIDSQFGADYAVRVFKGDPNSGGVELSQAGATGNDTWFFDYSSGILNFTGTDNHSTLGVTDTNIYILGYRYTGGIGAKPPSGIGTFSSLYVTGISTFVGLVDINGGGQANTFKVEDLTAGRVTYAGTGGELQDSANLTFDANSNLTVTGGVKVTGVSTFSNDIRASANLSVTGISTLGSIGISTGLITGPAITYIDPATVGDDTGTLVVKGNLQVDGTQTTVNSATMTVTDKNIVVAQGSANDAASDGAGITVDAGSDTDKTWNWVDATDAWTSSENIQVAAGKQLGFADDTNTYIDRPAADTIKFTAGGSERLIINTDGNTKITGALNVTGISTFNGNVNIPDSTASSPALRLGSDADLKIHHDGSDAYLSNATGQIAIKTPDNSVAISITDSNTVFGDTAKFNSSVLVSEDIAHIGDTNTKITFPSAGDIITAQTGGTERFRINADGNTKITGGLNVTGITTVATFNVGVSGQTLVGISTILDEDNMASDSATALATQQSIKKYVDDRSPAGPGGGNLAVSADSGTNQSINLNTDTLDIEGTANEIETVTGTHKVIIGLPDDVTIADDLTVTGDIASVTNLNVTGVSTFTGNIDANGNLDVAGTSVFNDDVTVDADLTANNLTVRDNGTGNPTVMIKSDDQDVNSLVIKNDTYSTNTSIGFKFAQQNNGEFTISNRGASEYLKTRFRGHNGSAAVDILTFNKDNNVIVDRALKVAGISTFSGNVDVNANADISGNLVVGAAGTTITTTVGAAASVGIGTANPAYMLDVAGAINSSTDVKINGTSVLNSALDEAVAMAIALG